MTITLASILAFLTVVFEFGSKVIDGIEDARQSSEHAHMKADHNKGRVDYLQFKIDSLIKSENTK